MQKTKAPERARCCQKNRWVWPRSPSRVLEVNRFKVNIVGKVNQDGSETYIGEFSVTCPDCNSTYTLQDDGHWYDAQDKKLEVLRYGDVTLIASVLCRMCKVPLNEYNAAMDGDNLCRICQGDSHE